MLDVPLPRWLTQRFHDVPEVLAVAQAYCTASAEWDEPRLDDWHGAVEALLARGGVLHIFVLEVAACFLSEEQEPVDLVDRVAVALERAARSPRHARERIGAVIALQEIEDGAWGQGSVLWEIDHHAALLADRVERFMDAAPFAAG
jgi:hypothetical protein